MNTSTNASAVMTSTPSWTLWSSWSPKHDEPVKLPGSVLHWLHQWVIAGFHSETYFQVAHWRVPDGGHLSLCPLGALLQQCERFPHLRRQPFRAWVKVDPPTFVQRASIHCRNTILYFMITTLLSTFDSCYMLRILTLLFPWCQWVAPWARIKFIVNISLNTPTGLCWQSKWAQNVRATFSKPLPDTWWMYSMTKMQ